MAEAVVEERQLLKALRWYDGFVVALANPGFLLASLGGSIGVLGGWGAMGLWSISMFLGVLANFIYSETAAMFPEKPGGIALYAHEGWRRYFSLVGPVATFGYWFAWSSLLAIFGLQIGFIVQEQWAPGETWTLDNGAVAVGLPHFVALGLIVAVWVVNIFGIRPAVWMAYMTGALLLIPLAVFIIVPYATGDWSSSNLSWAVPDWQTAIAWLWLMSWSAYGVETCAAFAPEYKDTVRDTSLALRSSALFSLAVYAFLPMGSVGVVGEELAAEQFYTFFVPAFDQIVGGASDLMVVLLIASLVLSMNTATADGSRALYGIARDDMTIKQLFHLNRFHVPGRAMTLDMIINLLLVFFLGNIFAILLAGNIGYVASHIFALSAFLLLRRDRPNWPRPIKVRSLWVPVAAVLMLANTFFLIIGAANPGLIFYGFPDHRETWIGIGVLGLAVLLFLFRRVVQDKKPVTLREETPTMPPTAAAPATGVTAGS